MRSRFSLSPITYLRIPDDHENVRIRCRRGLYQLDEGSGKPSRISSGKGWFHLFLTYALRATMAIHVFIYLIAYGSYERSCSLALVFHRTVQDIRERNADTDPDELQRIIDQAVSEVRAERYARKKADRA